MDDKMYKDANRLAKRMKKLTADATKAGLQFVVIDDNVSIGDAKIPNTWESLISDYGMLQDIQEVIKFLQWAFRKIDKGDTPEETVRMLLMNRAKIDNIKFDSNDRITAGLVSCLFQILPKFKRVNK